MFTDTLGIPDEETSNSSENENQDGVNYWTFNGFLLFFQFTCGINVDFKLPCVEAFC